MSSTVLPAELEARIRVLEDPAQQGADFDRTTWFWLVVLGIVVPAIAVLWGVS